MEVTSQNNIGDFFSILIRLLLTLSLASLALSTIIFIFYRFLQRLLFNKSLEKSQNNTYLLVKIPTTNERKEEATEELLKSLHRLLPNNTFFSLEMAFTNQFLRFYIVIPKDIKNVVESQLYAQYPQAEVDEVADFLPEFTENTAAAKLTFKKSTLAPLKTYSSLEENLLKNLSALSSKTESGEETYLQLVLKKVSSKTTDRGLEAFFFSLFGKKHQDDGTPTPLQAKFAQDLYQGQLRLIYTAKDQSTATAKLNTLVNLLNVVKGPANEFKKNKIQLQGSDGKSLKARVFTGSDFWTPAEIATIYHYPYKDALVSNVVSSASKRAPAPDILPIEGQVDSEQVSFFGETNYQNEKKKFGIKRADRRRHLYVIGKSGSGKSRFLQLLLLSDIQNNQGCCLLDPHGDLADEILMFIPKERVKDVIYINPADRDYPIGFNPLEAVDDFESRQHLATFFIAIFKKLFASNWNQRMEHLIRYTTLALLETPDSNILGIPRMLSDTTFRQRVIKQIQDPVVKNFWTNEFAAWNESFASDSIVPLLNKVGQFIANPIIRNMIGQRKNSLDFEKFMNEGKIVIINISKGKLGDDNTALLGAMFITKIQQAALARAKMKEEDRKDFYFYVDEFQNFATDAFSTILSEARKYRLNLTIAHQYIAQLPEDVKATAFGNVGSIVTFAVGGDDADYLTKEFAPVFSAQDLIGLNLREMYIKMSIDGKTTPPFSARTIDVPKPNFDYSQEIFDYSRLTYGKNRVSVENEIAQWTSATEAAPSSKEVEEFPKPII